MSAMMSAPQQGQSPPDPDKESHRSVGHDQQQVLVSVKQRGAQNGAPRARLTYCLRSGRKVFCIVGR